MKVTIEGTLEQITPMIRKGCAHIRLRRRDARNKIIAEQAAILRKAFLLVRYDQDEKALAESLLAALVGRSERTETILETARTVIASAADHGQ